MARAPAAPGLYWLALDEGGSFMHPDPLLVRVTVIQPYGEGRIEFLDYPGLDPEKNSNPIIDEPPNVPSAGLRAFPNGAHFIFWRREVALHWLGPVKPPKRRGKA